MKIRQELKIRNVADENIVLLRSNMPDGTSKILSLNATSVYLWESLAGKEFTTEDVCALLLGKYEVEAERAREDAAGWVARMEEAGALV